YLGVSESSLLSPGLGGAGVAGGVDAGADWGSGAGCDGADCVGVGGAAGIVTTCAFLSGRYRAPFCPQPASNSAAPPASSQPARFKRASLSCRAEPAIRAPGGRRSTPPARAGRAEPPVGRWWSDSHRPTSMSTSPTPGGNGAACGLAIRGWTHT